MLARLDHAVLARQTLVGGNYELLRCSSGQVRLHCVCCPAVSWQCLVPVHCVAYAAPYFDANSSVLWTSSFALLKDTGPEPGSVTGIDGGNLSSPAADAGGIADVVTFEEDGFVPEDVGGASTLYQFASGTSEKEDSAKLTSSL